MELDPTIIRTRTCSGLLRLLSACKKYLIRQLEVVENHLKLNQTVLEGGFGLADIFLMSCFMPPTM